MKIFDDSLNSLYFLLSNAHDRPLSIKKKGDSSMFKNIGNGTEMEATISSKGGMVTDFVWQGKSVIFRERQLGGKSRGGIPICMPFFGNPSQRFTGMRRHGFLRDEELRFVSVKDSKVVLEGRKDASNVFPWSVHYEIIVKIDQDLGLYLKLTVTRLKDGSGGLMPINPAFHPYFKNAGRQKVRSGKKLMSDFGNPSTRIPIDGKQVIINNGQLAIVMILGGDFNENSCLTLWSDDQLQYFCAEPVLTFPELFDTAKGQFLREGEESTIDCWIIPT
jgi:galactose mutarotase-like enzyme